MEGEYLLQQTDKFLLHVLVDVAVAGEGSASFGVAAEWADKIRVFDFLIKVADEGASGEVAAGDFVNGPFLLFPGGRIQYCHHTGHTASLEYFLDGDIVFLRTDERNGYSQQIDPLWII